MPNEPRATSTTDLTLNRVEKWRDKVLGFVFLKITVLQVELDSTYRSFVCLFKSVAVLIDFRLISIYVVMKV